MPLLQNKHFIRLLTGICFVIMVVPLFVNETIGADIPRRDEPGITTQNDFLLVDTTILPDTNQRIVTLTAQEDLSTFIVVREQFEVIGLDAERNEVKLPQIEVEERYLNLSVLRWYPDFLKEHFEQFLNEIGSNITNQAESGTTDNTTTTPSGSEVSNVVSNNPSYHGGGATQGDTADDTYNQVTYGYDVDHLNELSQTEATNHESLTANESNADSTNNNDSVNTTQNTDQQATDQQTTENNTITNHETSVNHNVTETNEDDLDCEEDDRLLAVRFMNRNTQANLVFLNLNAGETIELLVRTLIEVNDFDVVAYKNIDVAYIIGQTLFTFEGTSRTFRGIRHARGIMPMSASVTPTREKRTINTAEIRITSPQNSPINTPTSPCVGYTTIGGTLNRQWNEGIVVTRTATVGVPITLTAEAPNASENAQFQWYVGDVRIPGATSLTGNTFTPQTRGNYVFQVVMSNNDNLYASNRVEVRVGGGPAIREFEPIHNPVDESGITVNLFNYGHGVNRFTDDSGLGFHHVTHWNPTLARWGDREYWRIQTVNAGVHYHPWVGNARLPVVNNRIEGYYIRRPAGNAVMSPANVVGAQIWFSYSRINNNVGQFHDRGYVVHRRQNELVFRNLGADGFPVTRRNVRMRDLHYGRWGDVTFPGRSLNYLFNPNYTGITEASALAYNTRFPHNNPNIPFVPGVTSTPWVTARTWNEGGHLSVAPHFIPTAVRQNYDRRTYRPQVGNSGLFQRDADGFFYYDSIRNHAYFNRNTNRFELYDYIMYPYLPYIHNPTTGRPTCRRPGNVQSHFGNFLPFNRPSVDSLGRLHYANRVLRNNVAGRRVITTAPSSWYNWRRCPAAVADLWLGMHIEVDFYMPHDGQVQDRNGELIDMIFEFAGDDDVWVFINGVLVLDIGGTSNADHGLINFRTGQVTTNRNPLETNSINTTLYQQFRHAAPGAVPPQYGHALCECQLGANMRWRTPHQVGTDAGAHAPARRVFDADEFGGGNNPNTFAPGTTHTLSFFFMERHAGLSHCFIRFNLPTIPDIAIGKEVDTTAYDVLNPDIANEVEIPTDLTFDFQLEVGTTDANLRGRANESYRVYALESFGWIDRVFIRTGVTDAQGQFSLQDGEVAIFPNIPNNLIFRVTELPISTEYFSNITVDAPYTLTRSPDGRTLSVITDTLERGIYPKVIVTNQLRGPNVNDLEVVKRVLEEYERDPDDRFRFQVVFGEDAIPYSGYYYVYRCNGIGGFLPTELHRRRVDNPYGFIYLTQDEKFVIRGIHKGTLYRVEEVAILDVNGVDVTDEYHTPEYALSHTREVAGNIIWYLEWYGWYVEGEMYYNANLAQQVPVRVQFTNRIPEEDPLGGLLIFKYSTAQKEIDETTGYGIRVPLYGAEFSLFTREDFEAGNLDSPVYVGVSNAYGYIIIQELPLGAYVLVETRAPEGYELLRSPIMIYILEDDLYISVAVPNHPQSWLPFAGGAGHMKLLLISMGILLLGFGVVGMNHLRKKQHNDRIPLMQLLQEVR